MEFKDDLIWVKGTDGRSTPPLLSSTVKLLKTLQYDLYGNDYADEERESQSKTDTNIQQAKNIKNNTKITKECQSSEIIEKRGGSGKCDGINGDDDSKAAKFCPIELQNLKRVSPSNSLVHSINTALEDIYDFKHRDNSAKKSSKRNIAKNERFRMALEKQRDVLQKMAVSTVQDSKYPATMEDDEVVKDAKEPWIRLAQTLNSLAILTPILEAMLHHEYMNNKDIILMNSVTIDTPKCWLLGVSVFDISSKIQAIQLDKKIRDLCNFLDLDTNKSKTTLLNAMQCIVESFPGNRTTTSMESMWCRMHHTFLHNLQALQKQDLASKLSLFDKHFGLLLEKSNDDNAKHQLYIRSIQYLHQKLATILSRNFPGSRVFIYGSCLSDLSLGKAADVDLSFQSGELLNAKASFESGRWSADGYQRFVKKFIYKTMSCIQKGKDQMSFRNTYAVPHARVPVIRGTCITAENPYSSDGSLDFDICFLNTIAIANSELLRQYTLVNPRVKQLMVAVKRWTKANNISSAQDRCLSSYAWVVLVIFYLQCIDMVPNLQCPKLMAQVGVAPDPDKNEWHRINHLDTFFLTWEQVRSVWNPPPDTLETGSVTALLYGFFSFYTQNLPNTIHLIAIKRGKDCCLPKTVFPKTSLFLSIEDPFETFDSHVPHDLGSPTDNTGALLILHSLREAEMQLKKDILHLLNNEQTDLSALNCSAYFASVAKSEDGSEKQKKKSKPKNQKWSKRGRCFYCQEEGHAKSDCPKRKNANLKIP